MGFMDTVFGNNSTASTSARAPSKYEKAISQVVSEEAKASQPLYNDLIAQSRAQQGYNTDLFNQYQGSLNAYNQAFSPEQQGQQIASWMQGLNDYGTQDQGIQNQLMQMLQGGMANATPEQIALISQIAQNATDSGLSDLRKFQNDALYQIQQNAAGRGLRPSDTPILNQFGLTGEEYGRQAEQLISQIRQQQLQQQLAYPLQANQAQLQGLTSASDMANRRAQFQAGLASEAQQNAANYGRGITATGLGLAQNNGSTSLSPLVSSRQFQSGNVTQTQTPSPFQAFTQLGAGAGSAGMGF